MSKITNTTVSSDIVSSDIVKYVGEIPTCALPQDCTIDATQLTYLLGILLQRYCDEFNIVDADLSSVDIACLIANNPDVVVPESVTIETLSQYYSDVVCKLYTTINELQNQLDNINGVICMNETVTLNENTNITVDSLFNDVIIGISGTPSVTIVPGTGPYNGIASVVSNKILYTPTANFTGNDILQYQLTKGGYTCTGKINFSVIPVVTETTINDIVTTQLVTLLSSPEYWDIGIPIGTKLGISQTNISDFTIDPTGLNLLSGKGKPGTKWAKWAICNGKNGTENFTDSTFRGYNETNTLYNLSTKSGGTDSQTFTLDRNNIPPHKHEIMFWSPEDGDPWRWSGTEDYINTDTAGGGASNQTWERGYRGSSPVAGQTDWQAAGTKSTFVYTTNSADGVANVNNDLELKSTPDSITISTKNAFKTLILVQKIS